MVEPDQVADAFAVVGEDDAGAESRFAVDVAADFAALPVVPGFAHGAGGIGLAQVVFFVGAVVAVAVVGPDAVGVVFAGHFAVAVDFVGGFPAIRVGQSGEFAVAVVAVSPGFAAYVGDLCEAALLGVVVVIGHFPAGAVGELG